MREFCKQFHILALSLIVNISAYVSYFPTSYVFSCRSSVLDGCESGFMVFENSWLDPHSSMTLRSLASPPDKTLREDAVTSRASYSRSLLNSLPPLQGCSPLKPYLNCYYCVEFIAAAFQIIVIILSIFSRQGVYFVSRVRESLGSSSLIRTTIFSPFSPSLPVECVNPHFNFITHHKVRLLSVYT
jgi:hypothetical protein